MSNEDHYHYSKYCYSSTSDEKGGRPSISMKINSTDRYIIGNTYDIPVSIDISGGRILKSLEVYIDNCLYTKIDLTDNPSYHFDIVLEDIDHEAYIRVMVFDSIGYNECSLTLEFATPIYYGIDDNPLEITDQLLPLTLVFNGTGHVVLKYPKDENGFLTRITNDGDEYLSTFSISEETIGDIQYLVYTSKESAKYNNTQLFFDNNTILEPAKIYYGINDKLAGCDDELPITLRFNGKGLMVIKYIFDYPELKSVMNGGDDYINTLLHSYEIINGTRYHVYISKKIAVYNNTKMELYV